MRARIATGLAVVVLVGGGIAAWQLTRPSPPKPVAEAAPPVGYADDPGVPFGWRAFDVPHCASGTVGAVDTDPPAAAVAALQRHLPEFMVRDGAQTFDQSGRACGAVVHARDEVGTRMVVLLTAPPANQPAGQTTNVEVGAADVVVVTRSGWRVEVSVVGYGADLPPAAELNELAHDPHLVS